MASITRRIYWVDPATGAEVPRGTPGAVRRQAKRWRIRLRTPAGKSISRIGYTDRRATEQLASKLEAAAARGEELLVDQYAAHNKMPLARHVEEFLRDLEVEGRDDAYRYVLKLRLNKLSRECRWTRLCDVTAESLHAWRLGQAGKSGKTLNDFLDAVRRLMNWAVEVKRAPRNPVAGMARLPHRPVFERRALQADELRALFAAAPIERYRVYVFAVTTGLRRQEIADLRWGDVKLDVPRPFLALRAEATKARRDDDVPLKPEIAVLLRGMRPAGAADEDPVFAEVPSAQTLRQDLAAAGVELPTAEGERLDFHSLRTTLGSFLGTTQLPERVGMEILRVTDPKLLRRTYCDPRVLRTGDAITAVPIPTEPARTPESQAAKASGTTDSSLSVDALPDKNRTQNKRRKGPPGSASGPNALTVVSSRELEIKGGGPHVSASGLMGPLPPPMTALGIEPRTHRLKVFLRGVLRLLTEIENVIFNLFLPIQFHIFCYTEFGPVLPKR